ncbi:MAG: hypothetical protein R3300_18415 [Candidatus Promineifilaceae bacterium]|nr:hypothetical protein [Candidatus Promineifilaceae bacterium]
MPILFETLQLVGLLLMLFGLLATFSGLLGLYPKLSHDQPTLAGVGFIGAALAALGIITGIVINAAASIAASSITPFQEGVAGTEIILMIVLLSAGLSFLFYAIAALRHEASLDALGGLLLVPALALPAAIILGMLVEQTTTAIPPALVPLIAFGLVSLSEIGTGYFLRTEMMEEQPGKLQTA